MNLPRLKNVNGGGFVWIRGDIKALFSFVSWVDMEG